MINLGYTATMGGWDSSAVLPGMAFTAFANAFAWALVLGWLFASLAARAPVPVRRALVFAALVWGLVPGAISPSYWLGLTFRAPSLMTCLIVFGALWHSIGPQVRWLQANRNRPPRRLQWQALAALILGYILFLDTLALLPLQIYAMGFSPLCLIALGLVSVYPWVFPCRTASGQGANFFVLPLALLLFVLTRWPSGNVWDAVLDPCLWLVLHRYVGSQVWQSWYAREA
jgi:hypothetical protein